MGLAGWLAIFIMLINRYKGHKRAIISNLLLEKNLGDVVLQGRRGKP